MFLKMALFLLSQFFLPLSRFGQQVSLTGMLQTYYLLKFPSKTEVSYKCFNFNF